LSVTKLGPTLVLAIGVGAIPLADVALIGVLRLALRRLRARREDGAAETATKVPAGTFLCLHFLALTAFAALIIPDTIERRVLGTSRTAPRVNDMGFVARLFTIEALIVGLVVSGPPLLLSWVGSRVANRWMTRMSRRRFLAMTGLVSLGFFFAGLSLCAVPQRFNEVQLLTLTARVVDENSGRPIAGAVVRLTDQFPIVYEARSSQALTEPAGRAHVTGVFEVVGRFNAFRDWGVMVPWGRWLDVSAADHRGRRLALTEILGSRADAHLPDLGTVALALGEPPAKQFGDLAGSYNKNGDGSQRCWLNIEPDGRLTWGELTYDVDPVTRKATVPKQRREYGFLNRHDRTIEFVVVPHPDGLVDPRLKLRYRLVEWEDGLYLCPDDPRKLRRFCWAAPKPNRPSDWERRMFLSLPPGFKVSWSIPHISEFQDGIYLRDSGVELSWRVLPRLPLIVWIRFAVVDMYFCHQQAWLRQALVSRAWQELRNCPATAAVFKP
jgi:hypothetical protein